jgi:DNA-binding CsgD family transcriptional regulator
MDLRVVLTGIDHWRVEGLAHAIARMGMAPVIVGPEETEVPSGDVLVALDLPEQEAMRLDRALPPTLPVLWMTATPPPSSRPVQGRLRASASEEQLAAAITALTLGLCVQDEGLPSGRPDHAAPPPDGEPLTPRELQVFELMAKGLANREIAQALGITVHTVKFHVTQILEKTGAATRTEAVRQGLRMGWIGL